MSKTKNNCLACGTPMKAGRGDWKGYALPGVTLVDIPIYTCPKCGEVERGVENAEQLGRAIAAALVEKPGRLAPAEIRYLRGHLGLSSADMAKHMGTTPETVSRWEHGATTMGVVADRLLRALLALREAWHYPLDEFRDVATGSARPLSATLRRVPSKGWVRDKGRRAA